MKKGQPKNQKLNPSIPWRLYLIIGFIALPVFGAMAYLLQQTKNISDVHDTILGDIREIEQKSMAAHLWFEEILSGDSSEKIDSVRDLLKQAEDRLHTLIGREFDSGEHTRQHAAGDLGKDIVIFHLNHKPHVIQSIQETIEFVEEKLNQFKNMLEKRYSARQTSGPGTEIDQRFDRVFAELMGGTGEIIKKIKASKANHLAQFRVVQTFLISLCLALAVLIALILHRFERRRADDLLSLSQREKALQKSGEKYRTLIENAGEAIIVAQDGIFKFANPKGEELYGFSKEELASRPLTEFIHEEDREMVGDRHKRRLRGEELPKTYPFRIINKVGDTKWVQLSAVPFSWDNKPAVLCYMTDITERKRVEEALQESEDKYRSIIENIEEGYYEIDDKGKFVFINEPLERIFGRSESELIGRFIGGFTDEANRKIGINAFTEVFKTGNPLRGFEWEISQKDGGKRYVSASVSLMPDPQGNRKGLRGIIRDVTRRRKDEEKLKAYAEQLKTTNIELDEAKQAAENATKAKSEFLANMSHELRTPLNAIIGFSEQMTEPDFDLEKLGEYAKIIENSGKHQLRVVNEILDISKIEAGKLELEKIPFNFDALLKDVQSTGRMVLKSRNKSDVIFNVNYPNSISDYIIGDPTKFRQVLLNFLGNATRFTKKGSINIDVRLRDEKTLECCVEDTGTGIPKDKLETIFEPFQQVDASTTRKYGGTGLGLDLNKKLINLWGGEIWVDSIQGKGSKFSFTMPYIPAEKPQDKKKSVESYKIDPKKDYKILIAEDNPVNLKLAMMYLKSYGLRNIITASDGVEAVSAFKEHQPDLVLMDVHMPVLDGLSATKEIREYEKNSGITEASIIALTASAMEGDREKCLDAGCNDYTTKPIIKVELEKKIAQNLK